jgi:hypothetical protein
MLGWLIGIVSVGLYQPVSIQLGDIKESEMSDSIFRLIGVALLECFGAS